jgi:FRG domain
MPIIDCDSWESFLTELAKVRQAEEQSGHKTDFLYRGIGDSTWALDTTLERAGFIDKPAREYMEIALRIKSAVESFTGTTWKSREYPEIEKALSDHWTWTLDRFPGPEYSYLAYLRHHGFPSPLLDWTRSPFVATFFAFRMRREPTKGKVSVFVFSESPLNQNSSSLGEPDIHSVGPYVRTHKRHHLQQSTYTVCATFGTELCFARHSTALTDPDRNQDLLWKFNLPWGERGRVLRILDEYNLNAFSLFDSEESLMETLATRAFAIK